MSGEPLGVPPRRCSCGEAMEWRAHGHPSLHLGVYTCHHCDRPCAGVGDAMKCPLCTAIAVKR